MKIFLCLALVALYSAAANAACTEVDNCDTCSNPGPQCTSCPKATILSAAKTSCLSCGTGCEECTADATDKITCSKCAKGYYLSSQGACTECGNGCAECTLDKDGKTVVCSSCQEAYGTKTDDKGVLSCVACSSNCKACTVGTDGSTNGKCTTCVAKYFLKKADKTCSTCPSNCESCSDDGNGAGKCKTCKTGYVALVDAADSTKDGTSCLSCPSDCTTCSGTKNGAVATCTACKADKGFYVNNGACTSCGTGAKTCTDQGVISDCLEEYRFETGGSCSACPAFCKSCPKDSNGDVTCATCKASYAPKAKKDVTCDSCGIANCKTCARDSAGAFTCSECKTGYTTKSSTECVACGSSCNGCTYSSSKVKCTACKDNTYAASPNSDGECAACSTNHASCLTCEYSGANLQCKTCKLPTHLNSTSKTCVNNADTNGNCKTASADGGTCSACNDGYALQTDKSCTQCTDTANCKACNTTTVSLCKTCKDGYVNDDNNFGGTCKSCSDKTWGSGTVNGIENCAKCEWSSTKIICSECKTGYLKESTGASCVANVDTINKKCVELTSGSTTNCKSCPTGYGPVKDNTNCPKCNDGNCDTCLAETGTEKKCTVCKSKYITTDAAGGECKACPANCEKCTYDSTNKKTICSDNKCADKFAKNTVTGACDACPENCASCQYDSTVGVEKVVCSANGCSPGYGNTKANECAACPTNCDKCKRSTDADADDTMYCETCSASYATNNDVCGACPSNCVECSSNKGTMDCSKCADKYALDSKKACTKCPTNCKKCSAGSSVICSECESGYSLSADGTTCTECSSAAFDSCATCTSTDATSGKANCTTCSSGYVLEDGKVDKSCKDVSSLACGSGKAVDAPAQCSACAATFTSTMTMLCARKCYSCGDVNAGVYVDKAKCKIPAEGANATADDAQLIDCLSGICFASFSDGKVASGCLPKGDSTGTCTGDRAAGETCNTAKDKTVCDRCCLTAKCNSFVADLDGKPDSAVTTAVNMALLVFATMFAMRF